MNKKQIENHLLKIGFKKTEFNTNNAWGFGGISGFSYKKDNDWLEIGSLNYRHAPSTKFVKGGGIFKDVYSLKDVTEVLNSHLLKI